MKYECHKGRMEKMAQAPNPRPWLFFLLLWLIQHLQHPRSPLTLDIQITVVVAMADKLREWA